MILADLHCLRNQTLMPIPYLHLETSKQSKLICKYSRGENLLLWQWEVFSQVISFSEDKLFEVCDLGASNQTSSALLFAYIFQLNSDPDAYTLHKRMLSKHLEKHQSLDFAKQVWIRKIIRFSTAQNSFHLYLVPVPQKPNPPRFHRRDKKLENKMKRHLFIPKEVWDHSYHRNYS